VLRTRPSFRKRRQNREHRKKALGRPSTFRERAGEKNQSAMVKARGKGCKIRGEGQDVTPTRRGNYANVPARVAPRQGKRDKGPTPKGGPFRGFFWGGGTTQTGTVAKSQSQRDRKEQNNFKASIYVQPQKRTVWPVFDREKQSTTNNHQAPNRKEASKQARSNLVIRSKKRKGKKREMG